MVICSDTGNILVWNLEISEGIQTVFYRKCDIDFRKAFVRMHSRASILCERQIDYGITLRYNPSRFKAVPFLKSAHLGFWKLSD